MLRLPKSMSRQEKLKRVDQVLKQFNLDTCKNVQIGILGQAKGISGGQKRRLDFATEILTDPPIIFADEPTSGLGTLKINHNTALELC
jgi:ATP-binding cassette, subfamily G (WHITE), eye pigment precursor transporter